MAESNREKNSILGRRSPLTRIRLRCISISTSMINCALFVWTAWHLSCGNVIRMTQTNRLQISVSSSFLVTANMILSLTNPVVMPVWICCLLGPFANADPIHSSSEIYPGIEMNTDVESTSGNISSNKRTRTEPYYQGLRERLPVSVSTLGSNGTNKERELTFNQVVWRAGKRGLGGGIPGAIAGAIQVLVLMWLRTIINYQSRYGTTFSQALRTLLNEGGIPRLYCGVGFALVQAPLARFISTAANDGVDSMLSSFSLTKDWGPSRTTVVASVVVGCWRMLLMRKLLHRETWNMRGNASFCK